MNRSQQVHEGQFFFDPQDPIYADHFPGRAVVPGSLIVEAFITAAGQMPGGGRFARLENFRFKRFVSPGTYAYRMVSVGEGESRAYLQCTLYTDGDAAVTGTLR